MRISWREIFAPQLIICGLAVIFFRDLLFSQFMIYGSDIVGLNFPVEQFITDAFKSHQLPLWNPYAASGYPFLPFSPAFYPLSVIFRLMPTFIAFNYTYLLHFLIAGISMYYLLRNFKVNQVGSLIGAIAFMFNGFMTARIFAGHYMLIEALSLFPLVFLLLEKAWSTQKVVFTLLAGFVFGSVALLGHPQPILYLFYFLLIYAVLRLKLLRNSDVSVSFKRGMLMTGMVTVFGLLISSITLIPSLEAILQSLRGSSISYAAATSYSLSPKQLITFLLPDFWGSYATSNYTGGSIYHEITAYIGVLPLIFAVCAAVKLRRNKIVLTFALLSALALFLALGGRNPLYKIIYYFAPGFSSLRVPARILMMYVFSTSILAGFGAGLFVEKFRQGGKGFVLYLRRYSGQIVVFLVILDLFFYGSKFLVPTNPSDYVGSNDLIKIFQNDPEKYNRVFLLPNTMTFNMGNIYKFFDNQSDASLTLRLYSELVDTFKARDENLNQAGERAVIHINNDRLLALFNTKYVVSEGGIGDSSESHEVAQPVINLFTDWDKRVPTKVNKEVHLYERYNYLPRAFMVYKTKTVGSESEVKQALTDENNFDPMTEIVLETLGPQAYGSVPESSPSAKITDYNLNDFSVSVETPKDGYLMTSEIYYPGWKAYIDGKETTIYKTDFAFRSVFVPEGGHHVRFTFEPKSFKIGFAGTMTGLILLIAIFSRDLLRKIKKPKDTNYDHNSNTSPN